MINNAYYYDKVSQQWKKIGSEFIIDSYPVGSFLLWSGTHRYPSGFMECKGQLLNKADYPELFSVIEYTYGGSGNSFNLPKFDDGRFFRSTGGNADTLGRLQEDAIRNITGKVVANQLSSLNIVDGALYTEVMGTGYSYLQNGGPNYGLHTYFDASKVVPTANENRPTNSSMIVLIKVKTVVERIPVDNDPYATEIKAGIFKITNEITGSRNDVVVTEKAVVNNTLSFEPYNKVEVDVFDFRGASVALQGTVYLSDKSSVPGRYLNTTKVIEAQLPKVQQKANGTYFIKVKQDNSLELVDIRPEFHHKSTTAEYYLDGVWYDKSGNKLQPQTYLPYSVTISSNNITSVNFENIYPSSKELGVGQRWVNEIRNRQFGVTYTNTAGRPIQIVVGYTYTGSNGILVYINGEQESTNSATGTRTMTIPPLATYKFVGVATTVLVSWLELK